MNTTDLPLLTKSLIECSDFRETHAFMELPEPNAFQLPVKCLQIGIGGYIRGHADCFLDLLSYGRIIAVQPNSAEIPQLLQRQDGLYTLVSVSGTDENPDYRFRIISIIAQALAARTQWDEVMSLVSSTPLELIIQVVTENGIKVDESDTCFDGCPKSAIGKLTKILYEQWRHFPDTYITVLDTDNISDNGRVAKESVYTMVDDLWRGQLDSRFQSWLDEHVTFPISLCDRIVPGGRGRITTEKLAEFWQLLGYRDECLVTAEPFKMWVIEDRFAGGAKRHPENRGKKPDFERIGVKLVSESTVKAYEDMKLQVLNGAHTSMVHAGCLLGIKFIKDTIIHSLIRPYIESLVFDEVAKFLEVPEADVIQFARDAITRFGNRQLEHTNYQVAMYGTEKVKDRLIPSIIRYIKKTGNVPKRLAFAIAILLRYVTGFKQGKGINTRGNEVEGVLGINESDKTYLIDDPRATKISNVLRMNLSKAESEPILDGILSDKEMFRVDLHDYGVLAQTIKRYYHQIKENGLEATLENLKNSDL
jgi:tagaturonate reductase